MGENVLCCPAWLNNKDSYRNVFFFCFFIINDKNWPDWASRKRILLILVLDILGVVDWSDVNQIFIMILYSVLSLLALPFGNAVVECTFSEIILIKHKLCWRMKDICLTQYPLHEPFKGMKSAVVISGWPWSIHSSFQAGLGQYILVQTLKM